MPYSHAAVVSSGRGHFLPALWWQMANWANESSLITGKSFPLYQDSGEFSCMCAWFWPTPDTKLCWCNSINRNIVDNVVELSLVLTPEIFHGYGRLPLHPDDLTFVRAADLLLEGNRGGELTSWINVSTKTVKYLFADEDEKIEKANREEMTIHIIITMFLLLASW